DVGAERLHRVEHVGHPVPLADELHVGHVLERHRESEPEHRVVLDDEDAGGHHDTASGSVTCTWVPRGTAEVMSSVPPSAETRSRMLVSPTPTGRLSPMPIPSSTTSMVTASSTASTSRKPVACAWRTTLVTASVAMR